MSYEESKLFSLLKKQDIDSLFVEATNYLCQTKSLFEEKEQLQQENERLNKVIEEYSEEKTQQEAEMKDLFIKSRIQKIWKLCNKRILNDMDILDIKFNLHQIEQCIENYEERLSRLSNKEIIGE